METINLVTYPMMNGYVTHETFPSKRLRVRLALIWEFQVLQVATRKNVLLVD